MFANAHVQVPCNSLFMRRIKGNYNSVANTKRRKFLKVLGFGVGSLVLGGFITRIFGIGEDDSKYALPIRSYKVLEKNDQLIFYNSKGHKLFTVSDDGDFEVS